MTSVHCEQLRYTWAERRLDGSGAGFGVVLRSPGWPAELLETPATRAVLTELSLAARRVSPEAPGAFLSFRREAGGSLLVAKRPVGTDGAGRPGNYCVHALFDPTATLGALDLEPLLVGGTFRLEREVDTAPDADADRIPVWAPEDWFDRAGEPSSGRGDQELPDLAEPLRHWDSDELHDLLQRLCLQLPADLVNQLEVEGGQERASAARTRRTSVAVELDEPAFASAVALGAAAEPLWWARRGLRPADWAGELDQFLLRRQPVGQLAADRLWARWDDANPRGRWEVAEELLRRPDLLQDEGAVAAVQARPALLDDLTEAGLTGARRRRPLAARWVAAVGSDAQVVDLAAELVASRAELGEDLLGRLVQRPPEELPPAVTDAVLAALDGSAPLSPGWRVAALEGHLAELPLGLAPQVLASSCTDADLRSALRRSAEQGVSLSRCWDVLGGLVGDVRRDRSFAGASRASADHLLTHATGRGGRGSWRTWAALWPLVAGASGWSPAVTGAFADARRHERGLRVQRTLLLVVCALLAVAVVVLALLLRRVS